MTSERLQIAIIGAGASGTISAIQLLRKLTVPATIYLIEKNEKALFRGAAYSSNLPYEPLNVQAGRMSIFNHLPDDFFRWIKEHKQNETESELTQDSFVSRRWFGDYLTEHFNTAASNSKFAKVEVVNELCADISYDYSVSKYVLYFLSGNLVKTDYIVFASGNETPSDILNQKELELLNEKYISKPWQWNGLTDIDPHSDLLFIGTGLTMVDYVGSLHKQNHKGTITCFSRNGYLPLPHAPTENIIYESEASGSDLKPFADEFKKNIRKAKFRNQHWQNVMDAFRPRTSRTWRLLSLDAKKTFLSRYKTYWEIHRHRMPQISVSAINELKGKKQLEVVAGNYTSCSIADGKIEFNYLNKTTKTPAKIIADLIINCTGPSADYYKTDNSLIKNLLLKGWMKQDLLKLGIETGSRGEIIQGNDIVLKNCFAIGPLRKAAEWETTAIREIRTQSESTAQLIDDNAAKSYDLLIEL
jgi:uncharacterized NAD(P)/FAD-binding protein YdhS